MNRKALPLKLLVFAVLATAILLPKALWAQSMSLTPQPTGLYTPKALLMPLHDQPNQLHISVGRGGGSDFNLSYSLTTNIAVFHTATIKSGSRKKEDFKGSLYHDEAHDYVLKGGLGYFTKTANEFIMEAYLGGGISKIDRNWYYYPGSAYSGTGEITKAKYWSTFGQYNIGTKRRRSEYAFGLRVAYSNYTDHEYTRIEDFQRQPDDSIIRRKSINPENLFSVEPAISYSLKLGGLKINAQTGYALTNHWAVLGRLSLQYNLNFSKES